MPAPVLACVGRDRVILREVRYPAVAAGEEPAVIRFQVMKELTDSADEVIIDYAPLGEAAPGEERRALVLTIRRELLAAYQALCKAAGLKLLSLTPRPFGTLACLRASLKKWEGGAPEAISARSAVALLTVADKWAEFCLVRDDTVVVARSLPAGATLAGEVRRNIAMYSAQSPRNAVSALYLAGNGENGPIQENLQHLLAIPIRSFDPLVDVEAAALAGQNRGAFAGAVGLLRAQVDGRPLPINFVSPKQPQAARDPNKRRLALVGGLAAFVLIGVASYCYSQLAALDREIEETKQKITENNLKKMPDVVREETRYAALSTWDRTNVPWLDEFYDLAALIRFPNAVQLSEITAVAQPPARDKDKPLTRMTVNGAGNADGAIQDFVDRITKEPRHYSTGETNPQSGPGSLAHFPWRFNVEIDLEKQPPDKYQQRLPAPRAGQFVAERTSTKRPPWLRPGNPSDGVLRKVAAPEPPTHVHVLPATPSFTPEPRNPRTIPNRNLSGDSEGGLAAPAPNFEQKFQDILQQRQQLRETAPVSAEGTTKPLQKSAEVPRPVDVAPPVIKGKKQ